MTNTSDNYGPPKTREELYERIRQSSKEEVILEEMVRLGFWPSEQEMPRGPGEEIRRMGELDRELQAIRTELSRLENEEAMRRALRKQRMAEARKRREETKQRREQERQQRALAWKQAKTKDINYLGEEVSNGLENKASDSQRLEQYRLPRLETAADLAAAMDITVGELRFLAFSRKVSPTNHYKRFYIPKKRGGQRLISAPMPRLKEAQYWILINILQKVPCHDAAHGFKTSCSIVTNATPHVGKDVVINMDLKDFFPTISYRRVKGLFRSLGFSEQLSIIMGLICTEPEVDEVVLDNKSYFVARSQRYLPQGAPSSPMITNIICRRMDKRLLKLADTYGFIYTRYADDITFSGPKTSLDKVGKILRKTRGIVEHEGFHVHPDKTRILHNGRQQEVTGVVVNHKLSIDRKVLRRLRAVLFQLGKDGFNGKRWGNREGKEVMASLEGYGHFISMVDSEKGAAVLEQIQRIKKKYNYKKPVYKRYPKRVPSWKKKEIPEPVPTEPGVARTVPGTRPGPEIPSQKKPWWKFW